MTLKVIAENDGREVELDTTRGTLSQTLWFGGEPVGWLDADKLGLAPEPQATL